MNFPRFLLISVALLVTPGAAAIAADLPRYTPPPAPIPMPAAVPVPVPVPAYKLFYLKGFVGMTNQEIDDFTNDVIANGQFTIEQHNFDSSPIIGFGVGMHKGKHLRFDVTGEYRGNSNFRGLDTYVDRFCGPGVCTNQHTGVKNEWLFLANAYWDVGNFRGVTPYVGAGIGTARIELKEFWDQNLVTNGLWWAQDNEEWNFAWALHAGLAFGIGSDLTVDVGYRYVDLGDATTGVYSTYDPNVNEDLNPTTLKDVESHDLLVSLRWNFGTKCCVEPVVPVAAPVPAPVPFK